MVPWDQPIINIKCRVPINIDMIVKPKKKRNKMKGKFN